MRDPEIYSCQVLHDVKLNKLVNTLNAVLPHRLKDSER